MLNGDWKATVSAGKNNVSSLTHQKRKHGARDRITPLCGSMQLEINVTLSDILFCHGVYDYWFWHRNALIKLSFPDLHISFILGVDKMVIIFAKVLIIGCTDSVIDWILVFVRLYFAIEHCDQIWCPKKPSVQEQNLGRWRQLFLYIPDYWFVK